MPQLRQFPVASNSRRRQLGELSHPVGSRPHEPPGLHHRAVRGSTMPSKEAHERAIQQNVAKPDASHAAHCAAIGGFNS